MKIDDFSKETSEPIIIILVGWGATLVLMLILQFNVITTIKDYVMKKPKIEDRVIRFKRPDFMKGDKLKAPFIADEENDDEMMVVIPYTKLEQSYENIANVLFGKKESLLFDRKPETEELIEVDTSKVTRFEVIDHRKNAPDAGRCFIARSDIKISFQDDNKTLKIFVNDRDF